MDRAEHLAAIKAEIAAGTYVIPGGDEGLADAILGTDRPSPWTEEQYQRFRTQHRTWSRERKREVREAERATREREVAAVAEDFEVILRGRSDKPEVVKSMARQFVKRLREATDGTVRTAEVRQAGRTEDVNADPEPREPRHDRD